MTEACTRSQLAMSFLMALFPVELCDAEAVCTNHVPVGYFALENKRLASLRRYRCRTLAQVTPVHGRSRNESCNVSQRDSLYVSNICRPQVNRMDSAWVAAVLFLKTASCSEKGGNFHWHLVPRHEKSLHVSPDVPHRLKGEISFLKP